MVSQVLALLLGPRTVALLVYNPREHKASGHFGASLSQSVRRRKLSHYKSDNSVRHVVYECSVLGCTGQREGGKIDPVERISDTGLNQSTTFNQNK